MKRTLKLSKLTRKLRPPNATLFTPECWSSTHRMSICWRNNFTFGQSMVKPSNQVSLIINMKSSPSHSISSFEPPPSSHLYLRPITISSSSQHDLVLDNVVLVIGIFAILQLSIWPNFEFNELVTKVTFVTYVVHQLQLTIFLIYSYHLYLSLYLALSIIYRHTPSLSLSVFLSTFLALLFFLFFFKQKRWKR